MYQRVNSLTGCPHCSYSRSASKPEIEITEYVKSIYSGKIVSHDRTAISPKELDIFIPDLKIGIEFNGLFWHSEITGKDKKYHKEKLDECKKKGIQLIVVWEDDWLLHKERVRNTLSYVINGRIQEEISEDIVVSEVTEDYAMNFLDKNHPFGFSDGNLYLSLCHKGKIVSVSSWKESKDSLILTRYCENRPTKDGLRIFVKYICNLRENLNFFFNHIHIPKRTK